MTGNDSDTDRNVAEVQEQQPGLFAEAMVELERIRERGLVDGVKQSIQGWRTTGGMTLNAALAIDAVFILAGAGFVTEATGIVSTLGWILVAIGILGVLEKGVRRIQ